MKFFVTLFHPVCTDDTDDLINRINAIGRPYKSAFWDNITKTTEVHVVVVADDPVAALTKACADMAQVTELIGVEPDAAWVYSEREYLRRLGGPAELQRMEDWLQTAQRRNEAAS